MATLVTPKSRRIRFALTLSIHDLNNVPLVSGTSFIKWHLPSSTAAEHRGRTPKCAIKDHRVLYDYTKHLPVRLTIDKGNVLQNCEVHFEVVQEYSAGGRAERIVLGEVRLNLAEYCTDGEAGVGSEDGGSIVRRYLMQQSKINSTLKLGILMRHTEGTRDYIAPALRTAPVFGGIAGVISAAEPPGTSHSNHSHADGVGEAAALPTLSSTNREMGEMQDMYRRTLAAYWASQPGEMRADECIEDIFSGGDGWGKNGRPAPVTESDTDSSLQPEHHKKTDGASSGTATPKQHHRDGEREGRRSGGGSGGASGSRGLAHAGQGRSAGKHGKKAQQLQSWRKREGEVDEFDVREDLRSWSIGEPARA